MPHGCAPGMFRLGINSMRLLPSMGGMLVRHVAVCVRLRRLGGRIVGSLRAVLGTRSKRASICFAMGSSRKRFRTSLGSQSLGVSIRGSLVGCVGGYGKLSCGLG